MGLWYEFSIDVEPVGSGFKRECWFAMDFGGEFAHFGSRNIGRI